MRIAITGGKGGTGKSMVSTSLAVEFAKLMKTALLDVDAECPNDHLLLSVDRKEHSKIYQAIPQWDLDKCRKCGKCASVCKQNAIVFSPGRYPAFVKDTCIGCKACISACPYGAISETKKEIGTIYKGKNYGVHLVSGELKLGELASGEVVSEARDEFEMINKDLGAEALLIDSAAGIGCPVIASLMGTDYIAAVTEPTPSALHDLKRVLYLAEHFQIKCGIIINKYDLQEAFCSQIETFAENSDIEIIGRIPYSGDFMDSTLQMRPVVDINPEYQSVFKKIMNKIISNKEL